MKGKLLGRSIAGTLVVLALLLLALLSYVLPRTFGYHRAAVWSVAEVVENAATDHDESYLRTLKWLGVDLDALDRIDTRTPLARVAMERNEGAVRILLSLGCDPNGVEGQGVSPLLASTWFPKNELVIQVLIEAGATREIGYLISTNNREEVRRGVENDPALLEGGLPLAGTNWTPLWLAVMDNNPDMVRLLLDMGASVDIQDKSGYTPLHRVCMVGADEMIELLLDFGADPALKNLDGVSPYGTAQKTRTARGRISDEVFERLKKLYESSVKED